jgi:hypothetical protein
MNYIIYTITKTAKITAGITIPLAIIYNIKYTPITPSDHDLPPKELINIQNIIKDDFTLTTKSKGNIYRIPYRCTLHDGTKCEQLLSRQSHTLPINNTIISWNIDLYDDICIENDRECIPNFVIEYQIK